MQRKVKFLGKKSKCLCKKHPSGLGNPRWHPFNKHIQYSNGNHYNLKNKLCGHFDVAQAVPNKSFGLKGLIFVLKQKLVSFPSLEFNIGPLRSFSMKAIVFRIIS